MPKPSASPRIIQTPGDAPKPDAFTATAVQTGQEGEGDADPSDAGEPSEVERLERLVRAQQAQIEALTGAVQNLARSQQGNGPKPSQGVSELPNPAEVDVSALKAPVLTREGWIVPPDFGTPAEFRQEQEDRKVMRAAMQKIADAT